MQRLLIALPVLNEESVLDASVRKLVLFVQKNLPSLETTIVIVDNGSTDNTHPIGESLAQELPCVRYRRLTERGKGRAIRTAWQDYHADIYAFMDIDLATDLEALPRLIEHLRSGSVVTIGSRFHKKSKVQRSIKRKIFSRGYRMLTHAVFGTNIKDLPCGFKAATSDTVRRILPLVQDNNWFFDTEFVIQAEKAGLDITEIPITWKEAGGSGRVSKVSVVPLMREYLKKTWRLGKEIRHHAPPGRTHFLLSQRDTPIITLFTVLVALFYGSTLRNAFVYDDLQQLVNNKYVHSIRYIWNAFSGCIWQSQTACTSTVYYRPFHNLSYIFTDIFSSAPGWYHFINLLYFLIAVTLVFAFTRLITKKTIFALCTAFIFLAHPINTEVVNWVACVPELLVAIFSLLSLSYYFQYRRSSAEHHPKTARYLALALLFYFCGLLSKETAAPVPILFLVIDQSFFKKRLRDLLIYGNRMIYGLSAVIVTAYFLMRNAALGSLGLGGQWERFGHMTVLEKLHAYVTLFAGYLEKLVRPLPLLVFHTFHKTSTFTNREFISSAIIVACFVSMGIIFYWKKKAVPMIAATWILAFLLPVLVFMNKIGENVFAERYLFLPSIGFSILITYVLAWLWNKKIRGRGVVLIAMALFLICSWRVVQARNLVWHNDESLYTDSYAKNPDATLILLNWANDHLEEGKRDQAEVELRRAVEQHPEWVDIAKVYNNLGQIERDKHNSTAAITYFEKSIATAHGAFPDPYINLTGIYIDQRQHLKALTNICKAATMDGTAETRKQFNRLADATIQAQKKKPMEVYMDVMYGQAFKKSNDKKITFESGGCDASGCYYVFTPTLDNVAHEELLHFLIMANTQPDNPSPIEIRTVRIDLSTNNIVVETAPSHLEKKKTFIFPSCDGVYYEVPVIAK